MSQISRISAFLSVVLSLVASTSQAAVIIGNLPQNADTDVNLTPLIRLGISFTMGASGYTLDSLDVRLGAFNGPDAIFELRADVGGSNPSSAGALFTFTNPPTQGSGVFTYTFTPPTSFTLQSSTKYWLYAYAATATSFDWSKSNPVITPTSSSGAATYGATRKTPNSGGAWGSGDPSSFQLNGTVVPEPSTVVMAGLSIVTIAATAFRRRRKS
jgi:hypothetical protein